MIPNALTPERSGARQEHMWCVELIEYIVLRVVRRFLVPYRFLLRFGRMIPYFRVNSNQDGADDLAREYVRLIRAHAPKFPEGRKVRILEVGAGVTDTVGLLLAEYLDCEVNVCDPYVEYDREGTAEGIRRFEISAAAQARMRRIQEPEEAHYDVVLSNSVLEHVVDPELFFKQMRSALLPGGVMIHRIDYRDHFFKYPYHFLTFSDFFWNHFLNPGDLFRWRLDDHLRFIAALGLQSKVLDSVSDEPEYEKIRHRVREKFSALEHNRVTGATLLVC